MFSGGPSGKPSKASRRDWRAWLGLPSSHASGLLHKGRFGYLSSSLPKVVCSGARLLQNQPKMSFSKRHLGQYTPVSHKSYTFSGLLSQEKTDIASRVGLGSRKWVFWAAQVAKVDQNVKIHPRANQVHQKIEETLLNNPSPCSKNGKKKCVLFDTVVLFDTQLRPSSRRQPFNTRCKAC